MVGQWEPYEESDPIDPNVALEAILRHLDRTGEGSITRYPIDDCTGLPVSLPRWANHQLSSATKYFTAVGRRFHR